MNSNVKRIILIVAPILLVAVLGSIFVNIGMDWFEELNKPMQWIPNVAIPIVWSVIYILFALVLIKWTFGEKLSMSTRFLLIINGIFNVLWCLIFFTLKQTFGGNIIIIINAILAVVLIVDILKNKKFYGLIMGVYPVWVLIATTLNTALWVLN